MDRILLLSDPKFHKTNFDYIIKTLFNNGYPLKIIFNNVIKRLHNKFQQLNQDPQRTDIIIKKTNIVKQRYFTIPFLNNISEKISKIIKNVSLFGLLWEMNKMRHFIRILKDKLSSNLHSNVECL